MRLFNRTTRSVAPTEAGERLLQAARPGLETIAAELEALRELRGKPAGTVRLTTSAHAYETILWPALKRLLRDHPDVQVEVSIEHRFIDIVAERFDAGIRLGEAVERDMIAVRIGPELRWIVVGAPSYLADRPAPAVPQDLTAHRCINFRNSTAGDLYAWEFEKDGRALNVRVEGPLAFNDVVPAMEAARRGLRPGLRARGHRPGAPRRGPPRRGARGLVPARPQAITSTTRADGRRRPPSRSSSRRSSGVRIS